MKQVRGGTHPPSEHNMKGFYIEVKNNLLERKHIENMRESVWLFMWFLDKITVIKDTPEGRIGKVLGGKPITYEEIESELGISNRTYVRWLMILRKHGYISTTRTPTGLSVFIHKASKVFKQNGVIRQKRYSDTPEVAYRYARSGVSNIRQLKDSNKDISSDLKIPNDFLRRKTLRID